MRKNTQPKGHALRKTLKHSAGAALKKHYLIFLITCLFAALLGTSFTDSFDLLKLPASLRGEELVPENSAVQGMLVNTEQQLEIINDMIESKTQAARTAVEESTAKVKAATSGMLGRTRGILSKVVNSISSGSFIVSIISGIAAFTDSTDAATLIFICIGCLLMFAFWFFVISVYRVAMARIFLEGRCYDEVSGQRFLFLIRVKRWAKASWVIFASVALNALWFLTIVGGFIKFYSYRLVPHIIAENPNLSAREAITLSRRMMNGHKWERFLLDCSFLGWWLLRVVTLGLSGVFYSNLYETATAAEYYANRRAAHLSVQPEDASLLNDACLFAHADAQTLSAAYADLPTENAADDEEAAQPGIWNWIARNFGIVLWNTPAEAAYEERMEQLQRTKALRAAAEGRAYPGRLFSIPEKNRRKKTEVVRYTRRYSVCSLILIFFVLSLIGWLWEVSLHLISDGVFVNRGVMHGPWLPIYGSGSVLILVVLNHLRKRPVLEFIAAIVLCGIVEYFTSYYLEITHDGMKWWDYSGYFLNLNGRICAEGLLVFGLGGMAVVYLLAPMLDKLFRKIPNRIMIPLCALLLGAFVVDKVYSSHHPNTGAGITDYACLPDPYADPGAPRRV